MCCSAARSLSPHLKVTCSLPCCSSRCCWRCNIWPQSSCGSGHPSCYRLPVGPVMRGHLLGWEHRNRQSGPEESLVAPDWPCAQTSRRGGVRCEAQCTARPHAPKAGPRLSFYSVSPCISLFGAPCCPLHVPTPPADRRPGILRSRCPGQGGLGEQRAAAAASSQWVIRSPPLLALRPVCSLQRFCHRLGPRLLVHRAGGSVVPAIASVCPSVCLRPAATLLTRCDARNPL